MVPMELTSFPAQRDTDPNAHDTGNGGPKGWTPDGQRGGHDAKRGMTRREQYRSLKTWPLTQQATGTTAGNG